MGQLDRAAAVSRLTGFYADAAVDGWALWLPSGATDFDASDGVTDVAGLKRDTTTLVMRASLSRERRAHDAVLRTSIAVATRAAGEAIPVADLPDPDRVPELSAWVLVHDGTAVAGAWSFLHSHRPCTRRRAALGGAHRDAAVHADGAADVRVTRVRAGRALRGVGLALIAGARASARTRRCV